MESSEIRQFTKIIAAFQPQHRDKLQPAIAAYVGRECVWVARDLLEIPEFQGQWAMWPVNPADMPFAWAPISDLANIRLYEAPLNLERKTIKCSNDGHFVFEATEQFDGYIKVKIRPWDAARILQHISEAMIAASDSGKWDCEFQVNGWLYAMEDSYGEGQENQNP